MLREQSEQQETLKSSDVLGKRCASCIHIKGRKPTPFLFWIRKRNPLPDVFFSTKNYSLHKFPQGSKKKKKNPHVQKGPNHFQRVFKC